MDTSNLIIETKRLILRPISLRDCNDIFKEFTKQITTFMFPQPSGEMDDTVIFINNSLDGMRNGKDIQQAVTNSSSGEFLGCAGFHQINTQTPELGIWIKAGAHGNKYGREAMKGLKNWADKNLEYDYIVYPVAVENISSRKLVESLGGKIEREFIGKKQNGELMNEIEYRIYK